jgi:uroporphyrinogen-III decarboxylase
MHQDPATSLPFTGETLRRLRKETEGRCSLVGFVGAPFTLAAYSVNGAADKNCLETKALMHQSPEVLHALLDHLAQAIGDYACYQVREQAIPCSCFEYDRI